MVEAIQLISIFDHLIKWIVITKEDKRKNSESYRNALIAIFKAANETQNYLTDRKVNGQNRKEERHLSWLWTEAGIALREIDHDLAERCLIKGEYWSSPDEWNDQQITEAGIKLNRIYEEAKTLI